MMFRFQESASERARFVSSSHDRGEDICVNKHSPPAQQKYATDDEYQRMYYQQKERKDCIVRDSCGFRQE